MIDFLKEKYVIEFWYDCPECKKHLGREVPLEKFEESLKFDCPNCQAHLGFDIVKVKK